MLFIIKCMFNIMHTYTHILSNVGGSDDYGDDDGDDYNDADDDEHFMLLQSGLAAFSIANFPQNSIPYSICNVTCRKYFSAASIIVVAVVVVAVKS